MVVICWISIVMKDIIRSCMVNSMILVVNNLNLVMVGIESGNIVFGLICLV